MSSLFLKVPNIKVFKLQTQLLLYIYKLRNGKILICNNSWDIIAIIILHATVI